MCGIKRKKLWAGSVCPRVLKLNEWKTKVNTGNQGFGTHCTVPTAKSINTTVTHARARAHTHTLEKIYCTFTIDSVQHLVCQPINTALMRRNARKVSVFITSLITRTLQTRMWTTNYNHTKKKNQIQIFTANSHWGFVSNNDFWTVCPSVKDWRVKKKKKRNTNILFPPSGWGVRQRPFI